MPDQPDDAISRAGQGVNWLVGLSGGAIGGALLKFDWLLKLPYPAKVAFLIAAIFFLASICFGVFYAFQLFAVKQFKDSLEETRKRDPANPASIQEAQTALTGERTKAGNYHNLTMLSFALAGTATIAALYFALFGPPFAPPKPAPLATNKYSITTAQVVRSGRTLHSHTFLLNQQTGEVWEMTCRSGKAVEFRRVPKASYDGSPEEPPATLKVP